MARVGWFLDDRFGMFIHFGLYSGFASHEDAWVRSVRNISIQDYDFLFHHFNPTELDMQDWILRAKEAGMNYVVLTAKHHEGFCLFDSQLTEYKVTNTPYKKDIILEFTQACRDQGLKVGLYYSLVDWHHPGYPAYGDRQHPHRDNPTWKSIDHDFDSYLEYMHGQVRELMTNYGQIDVLWLDFSYWNMRGEKWKATQLVTMIRQLQPNILINNRLGGDMFAEKPEVFAGDFYSPEQGVPPEGLINEQGTPIPWETCLTMNNSWAYARNDHNWKSATQLIRTLAHCVSKGGNLLLNVGPNALGEIPQPSKTILHQIGAWMKKNHESIYGCGPVNLPKPEWGFWTSSGKYLYAHITQEPIGQILLPGLRNKVRHARLLTDGSFVEVTGHWNEDNGVEKFGTEDDCYLSFGFPYGNTWEMPDKANTVVKIELL